MKLQPPGAALARRIAQLLEDEFHFTNMPYMGVEYKTKSPTKVVVKLRCDKDVYVYYDIEVKRRPYSTGRAPT